MINCKVFSNFEEIKDVEQGRFILLVEDKEQRTLNPELRIITKGSSKKGLIEHHGKANSESGAVGWAEPDSLVLVIE